MHRMVTGADLLITGMTGKAEAGRISCRADAGKIRLEVDDRFDRWR